MDRQRAGHPLPEDLPFTGGGVFTLRVSEVTLLARSFRDFMPRQTRARLGNPRHAHGTPRALEAVARVVTVCDHRYNVMTWANVATTANMRT